MHQSKRNLSEWLGKIDIVPVPGPTLPTGSSAISCHRLEPKTLMPPYELHLAHQICIWGQIRVIFWSKFTQIYMICSVSQCKLWTFFYKSCKLFFHVLSPHRRSDSVLVCKLSFLDLQVLCKRFSGFPIWCANIPLISHRE